MTQDSRYAPLFEPLKIGPVTAPNRFYQVPHCTGMGYMRPRTLAAMRAVKAEGGWGVVCTEYCSIHPTSDDGYYPFASNWDEDDMAMLAATAEGIHAGGALAGIELWHGGSAITNMMSREPTLGVTSLPGVRDPVQSHPMDLADIRALRDWHRAAALRAKRAGFDIVYVYPTHGYLLSEFLSRAQNARGDAYGGNLENRARLIRELIEDTKDAVGDRCAVAVRMSASGHGDDHLSAQETHDLIAMLGPLPDLWDMVVADYDEEMGSSRFTREGGLESRMAHIRALTGKPVVTVGRFTSPDTMLSQIRRGVTDLIGAARPSIADPFLPAKIRDGRIEDIRECIGCNICYAHNSNGVPIRCTQNPTMGEEWRRGWHPERVTRDGAGSVLILGAGPAGLEAAHILGKRGFDVALADAGPEPGGRVTRESGLPGLREWGRVRDYRTGQIEKLPNVTLYMGSTMTAADVADFGADHVLIATGATWRRNGLGQTQRTPIAGLDPALILTPDDIMAGHLPQGEVVVFDDDHYYMAAVIAELLLNRGARVTYATPGPEVAGWSAYTAEQFRTQRRLIEGGATIVTAHTLAARTEGSVTLSCLYTGRARTLQADALVLVTSREPKASLFHDLIANGLDRTRVQTIGDCHAPSIIAAAVYAGHKAGRELGLTAVPPTLRDRVTFGPTDLRAG